MAWPFLHKGAKGGTPRENLFAEVAPRVILVDVLSKMQRSSGKRPKPTPSNYQLRQRRTTIELVILFTILALAVGAAIYFYERHSLIP
jgi:hypothetical protein